MRLLWRREIGLTLSYPFLRSLCLSAIIHRPCTLTFFIMDIEACTPFVKNLHLVSPYEVFLQRLSLSSGMLQHGCVWTKIHISRAAHENFLPVSATMGGFCTHPDQSRGLALVHNDASDLWVGVSKPILSFFILGGAALT